MVLHSKFHGNWTSSLRDMWKNKNDQILLYINFLLLLLLKWKPNQIINILFCYSLHQKIIFTRIFQSFMHKLTYIYFHIKHKRLLSHHSTHIGSYIHETLLHTGTLTHLLNHLKTIFWKNCRIWKLTSNSFF